MATASKIEWTDVTCNPVSGCRWASPGCDNCYAAKMTRRLEAMGQSKYAGLTTHKHFNGEIKTHPDSIDQPYKWKGSKRVFVNSMSDLFHPDVPRDFIDQVFATMYDCQWLTFQVLTKRPENMVEYLNDPGTSSRIAQALWDRLPFRNVEASRFLTIRDCEQDVLDCWPLHNVSLGTSIEDQPRAEERIPHLQRCPASVRFLSIEPMLGPIALRLNDCWLAEDCYELCERLHWVIVGGESGHGARPMHPDWARSLRDQCLEFSVPFFFKQWGDWSSEPSLKAERCVVLPDGTMLQEKNVLDRPEQTNGEIMWRVGKKSAGRLLDSEEWSQFPVSRQ